MNTATIAADHETAGIRAGHFAFYTYDAPAPTPPIACTCSIAHNSFSCNACGSNANFEFRYYYAQRYYSASLARWLSVDPIEEAGGLNLYGFVQNAPTDIVDPFGLLGESQCKCGMEVGQKLKDVLNKTLKRLRKDKHTRRWVCNRATWNVVSGFDIEPLMSGSTLFWDGQRGCGTGPCEDTVSVNGRCYKANNVNYVLWGALNRICGRTLADAEALVKLWRGAKTVVNQEPPDLAGRLTWTRLGYRGELTYPDPPTRMPSAIEPDKESEWNENLENVKAEMTDNCPPCGASYSGKLTLKLRGGGNAFVIESF